MKHLLIPALVLLYGCSGQDIESAFVSPDPDRWIVETREPDQTDFIVLETPILTINEERSADLLFGRITDVKRLSSGTLVIADSRNHCLTYVSPEGEFIVRAGRRGAGPGELNLSSNGRISVTAGDTVSIFDQRNSRISKFDPSGTWISSFRINSLLFDFEILEGAAMLYTPHASQGVLVHSDLTSTREDTILSREGFTGFGSYLANGWLLENLGQRIYLYHQTSGLLLHSRSRNSPFKAVYLQDPGFRDMVNPLLNSDESAEGRSLSIRSLVFINGFATDVDEEFVYIQIGDERLGEYRRIVQLDKSLQYMRGWKIPVSMVSAGLAAGGGHLYSYSTTTVHQWF
ncbi:hypothetical protein ACFL41_00980 [Gemmatimonadota bacterium]